MTRIVYATLNSDGSTRTMTTSTEIPRPALVLGWLGVLPFAAFALAAATGIALSRETALAGLGLYGVVILSFMGGAQWGLAMLTAPEDSDEIGRRMGISVLPALAAFGISFLSARIALALLAASFLLLLAYDITTVRSGAAPAWYRPLRLQLTSAVILFLGVGVLVG